jgi:4-methylaminobutanoate oxidase (formaldehyde-forming)
MAGLGAFVKLKRGDFLGREALLEQRGRPLPRLLAGFTVEDADAVLLGRETIYRDGRRCGWLASGGYGHTIRKAIGYGYVRNDDGVDADYVMGGAYELDVAGVRVPALPFLKPPYDPDGLRVRG